MKFYVATVRNIPEGGDPWEERTLIDYEDIRDVEREAKRFARGIMRPVGTAQEIEIFGPFELNEASRAPRIK